MTKKILFIVTQSEFGGAQRFLVRLVPALDKNKYNSIVVAGAEGNDKAGLLSFLEKNGINTRHLRFLKRSVNPLFDFFLGLIEIYKLIRKEKPDVLFLCSSKAGAMGSLAGRLAKTPKIIYRIGGWTFNDPWPKWKKKIYILIERWTAKFKDIIINNAESDRQQAIKLGIKPKERIVTIYNGVDINKLDSEFLNRGEARGELNLRDSDFIIGTIASFYPTKGLEYLIEAANILKDKDIKFILIGEGGERSRLEKLIERHRLEKKFLLIKPTYKDYKYLKAFDIFVLPSVKEGFPWVILEAMTAEVPIIATKVGAIPEIQPGLLVEPGNPKELSDAIRRLLENKDLREKLVKKAKRILKSKFTLNKMVKEVEKLF